MEFPRILIVVSHTHKIRALASTMAFIHNRHIVECDTLTEKMFPECPVLMQHFL